MAQPPRGFTDVLFNKQSGPGSVSLAAKSLRSGVEVWRGEAQRGGARGTLRVDGWGTLNGTEPRMPASKDAKNSHEM